MKIKDKHTNRLLKIDATLRTYLLVVRNAWKARFTLVRYMCEEKEEKTCPSWMLAVNEEYNINRKDL